MISSYGRRGEECWLNRNEGWYQFVEQRTLYIALIMLLVISFPMCHAPVTRAICGCGECWLNRNEGWYQPHHSGLCCYNDYARIGARIGLYCDYNGMESGTVWRVERICFGGFFLLEWKWLGWEKCAIIFCV
jgi:hypothetical protein